jgi:hypothetical protein
MDVVAHYYTIPYKMLIDMLQRWGRFRGDNVALFQSDKSRITYLLDFCFLLSSSQIDQNGYTFALFSSHSRLHRTDEIPIYASCFTFLNN